MITWIDKRSVLMLADRKLIKAGQEVPAGVLSDARIELLKKQKKIKVVASEPVKPEKVKHEKVKSGKLEPIDDPIIEDVIEDTKNESAI